MLKLVLLPYDTACPESESVCQRGAQKSGIGPLTPSRHHSITPSRHHAITPSLHHSITPSLHHSITPSLHHSITPSMRTATHDHKKPGIGICLPARSSEIRYRTALYTSCICLPAVALDRRKKCRRTDGGCCHEAQETHEGTAIGRCCHTNAQAAILAL
jgi:hypothetical protein